AAVEFSGLGRLLRSRRPWSGLLVLNYHRIGDGSRWLFNRSLWSATAEELDRQIGFAKRHCEIIALHQLSEAIGRPGRSLLLTFDDGYRDNHTLAFPVLRAHGVPATFFLATGFLDSPCPAWWDEIA